MRVIGLVLALGLTLAPLAAQAQPPAKVYRISLFHVGLDHVPPSLDGLRDGLKALGYEEARTSSSISATCPTRRQPAQQPPNSRGRGRTLSSRSRTRRSGPPTK
jgi:hypothetical protein